MGKHLFSRKDHVKRVFAKLFACCCLLSFLLVTKVVFADEAALVQVDKEFIQASSKGDAAALAKFLDSDFTWTDAEGRTLSRAEVLNAPPKPALGNEIGASEVRQIRPQVEAIMAERDKIHVLRIWGKRGAEWHLLVYHEVVLGRGSGSPTESSAKECENPCKTVPYKPKNEMEQAILTSWEELETAVAERDAFSWSPHIASEFTMLGSTNEHALSKADRVATLNLQKVTGRGALPAPVLSLQMFDFGDTVVMTSVHQPFGGKALRVTRLWIRRDGKWVMSISYQTTIESSASKTS
jgi:Domain of unknown function (DUF4440)